MRGGGDAPGVILSTEADGDIAVEAPLVAITRNQGRATSYNVVDFLSVVKVHASGAVHINAPVTTDSALCIEGDSAVTIDAPMVARNATDSIAIQSSYGRLDIRDSVTLHARPDSLGTLVISGASIAIGADIIASGLAEGEEVDISYNDAFEIDGGHIRASGQTSSISPPIFVRCLCSDANGDQSCDAGCNSDPAGVNSQTVEPSPTIVPSLLGLDSYICGF